MIPQDYYIGIDLGKTGGIACIDHKREIISLSPMPELVENQIRLLDELCKQISCDDPLARIHITMEQTSARPGEGVVSVSTFAKHCGGIYYTCMFLALIYDNVMMPQRIAPALWKKAFDLIDSKLSKYEKKQMAVTLVNEKYGLDLKYKDNGISDALLIALYSKLEAEDAYRKCKELTE